RKDNRPLLTVLADGTVQVIDTSGVIPPITSKISAEELQDLLRFAIDEHHFFDFDRQTAEQELRAEETRTGRQFAVSDGVTTSIRIRTAERDHKAEFYALEQYATAHPGVKPLADLLSVQERLSKLFLEVEAKGKK